MLHRFMDALTHLPPLARFAIALMIFLSVPALCRRLRLPAIIGLLAAGIAFGPHGLQVAPKNSEVAHFFAEIGKLLLLFFAGLEIDLTQFHRVKYRALGFGMASFAIPLIVGTVALRLYGLGWLPACVVGATFASHTLLGYPIVQRLGIIRNESVTVAICGTIFVDVAALLVVAICIPLHTTGFSTADFVIQLAQLAIYIFLVLFVLSHVAQYLMKRLRNAEDAQLLVMLLTVVVASIGAEAIHLEGIIGAFLAGLAINRAVVDNHAKEQLELLGDTLFIPAFFCTIGFLIDLKTFANTVVSNFALVCLIVMIPIITKWLAAVVSQHSFGYRKAEGQIMWALTLPHVAATLAVALTAYETKNQDGSRLIEESVLNSLLVLVVCTAVLGPIVTERFGQRLFTAKREEVVSAAPLEESIR